MKKDQRRPRHRKARLGALSLIGGFMIASAFVRVAAGAGDVIAEGPDKAPDRPLMASEQLALKSGLHSEMDKLIAVLKEREETIKKRERDLRLRQGTVEVAEQQIQVQLEALEQAENRLKETIAIASTAAENDLGTLTEVYSNMKPKQAATLFEKMDPSFAAGFLARMEPAIAGRIMAGIPPDKAYVISVQLAGRNAKPPER